jgi:hypothetical protein
MPAGSVIAGFGLDVSVVADAGSVAQVSQAQFATFPLGTDAGDASVGGLSGVVGGQLANVLGANPGVATGAVETLFEFYVEIATDASGVVQLDLSSAGPFGALLVFSDGQSGSNSPADVAFAGVSIEITTPCVADVNSDGELNGLDFGAWLGAFNAGLPSADQNADGLVNGLDFGAWLSNFNAGCD